MTTEEKHQRVDIVEESLKRMSGQLHEYASFLGQVDFPDFWERIVWLRAEVDKLSHDMLGYFAEDSIA